MSTPGHRGGNAETLRRYWAEGEGAAKIRWGTPGDFDRCVAEVDKYMPGRAKGYCNLLHHRALGYYPATHAKMMAASHGALVQDLVDGGTLVSRHLPDGTLELAHLDRHGFVLALARHVRTEAGVRRYHLPIGSLIGSGKPGDAVRELRLHHQGKSATIRRTADGKIERRNPDRKTWRPATASETKIFTHAEKRHDADHAAIKAGRSPQRGADFVKAGEKAQQAKAAKTPNAPGTATHKTEHAEYPLTNNGRRVRPHHYPDDLIARETPRGKWEIVTAGKQKHIGEYATRAEASAALPATAAKVDAEYLRDKERAAARATAPHGLTLDEQKAERRAEVQRSAAQWAAEQDRRDREAYAAEQNRPTEAQVSYALSLIARRIRSDEHGGHLSFRNGYPTRNDLAKMTRKQLSSLITQMRDAWS